MKKPPPFKRLKRFKHTYILRTKNLFEAAIYFSLDCYISSYNLSHEGNKAVIEFTISGNDIMKARKALKNETGIVNINRFIDSYNYITDYAHRLLSEHLRCYCKKWGGQ